MKSVKQGQNQFCVPAALSIVTGKSVDDCAHTIQGITGQRYPVTAVQTHVMLQAAAKMRIELEPIPLLKNSSVFYAFTVLSSLPAHYFLIVRGHIVVIEVTPEKKIYLCDNQTKEPIEAQGSARLGQAVEQVWRVTHMPNPIWIRNEIRTELRNNKVEIYRDSIYENPSDNSVDYLGAVWFKNGFELGQIASQLLTHTINWREREDGKSS